MTKLLAKQSGTQNVPWPQQPSPKHTWPGAQLAFVAHGIPVHVGVTQTVEPPMVGMHAQAPSKQLNVSQLSAIGHMEPEICCAETFATPPMIFGAT